VRLRAGLRSDCASDGSNVEVDTTNVEVRGENKPSLFPSFDSDLMAGGTHLLKRPGACDLSLRVDCDRVFELPVRGVDYEVCEVSQLLGRAIDESSFEC
jgi:hypothetical protein